MQIDLGKLKFTWRGEYDAATEYEADDTVRLGASAYICVASDKVTGIAPTPGADNATWELMARGTDGKVLGVHIIESGTRTAVSTAATMKLFGGNFDKISPTSRIIATCTVLGAGAHSGNSGSGLVLDDQWDYGCAYQYDGQYHSSQTTILVGTSDFGVLPVGNKRIDFGWNTANGQANDRPFNFLNPNAADDARNQQMTSRIIVWEVEAE
ncbi:hypothetical protein TRICHSKD4_4958 [Roseibium sp. TrichSKD4]|uniref:hypothetical protein n=1 Tax=Roseibium sp. TrichSKD4 TaxID=744980 RepID=UPI0001E57337|nr:hypothetical protein [Roseibium sp. TrichSKD4]EFO29143.1 hypothetical protein TRICHSKD4_4958 [Roseibium sp. TrichSKD4]